MPWSDLDICCVAETRLSCAQHYKQYILEDYTTSVKSRGHVVREGSQGSLKTDLTCSLTCSGQVHSVRAVQKHHGQHLAVSAE